MSDPTIEKAFLAVMNANDRELALPLTDWAGRNLLKRRIAVALKAVLPALWSNEGKQALGWMWLENMVSAISDEHPSDIAYSADQMVDAFAAGMRAAIAVAEPGQ